MITTTLRYLRLLGSLGRYTLARELAFRGNFLVKVSVEVLWLSILLAFYATIFGTTSTIAGWSRYEYLFFVGCFYALNGLTETLFMENCNEFAELVRTGDLDFLLLKPIDEQFIITCRRVDWATAPNVAMGGLLMAYSLYQMNWPFNPLLLAAFVVLFGCGTAICYSFMVMLTALSVWMVRNQGLMEMWWLFSSLARYPKEIFGGPQAAGPNSYWTVPLGLIFTFVVPILLVVNVPADVMVRSLESWMIGFTLLATALLLWASRRFFQHALRSYRSASS
jgi:ABC-2 type transport system permease protein